MAVAFAQNITTWGAFTAGPQSSGSFTPTAGNTLIVADFDGSGTGKTLSYSGSVNTPTSKITRNDPVDNNTLGLAEVFAALGGSQTFTIDSSPTGDNVSGYAIEYSGVTATAYNQNSTSTVTSHTGIATVVPAGSVLVGFCFVVGTATTLTGQTNGGIVPNNRQIGTSAQRYAISEWAGNGGSVTPTWTSAVSTDCVTLQVLLTGAAGGSRPPLTGIAINPGGVPMGPSSIAQGNSAGQGSVRWQNWESYPWGPAVAAQAPSPQSALALLTRKAPRQDEEPEVYAPAQQPSLHRFRTTFQTVGQPWMVRYRPVTHRQEPEEYAQPPVAQTILFGRTTPVAQSRQPLPLLTKAVRRFDDEEELRPKPDYFLLTYGRQQIVQVTQAYYFGPPLPLTVMSFDPEEYPQPRSNLFAYRSQVVTQPNQPWFLLNRRAPSSLEDFIDLEVPRINPYRGFRTTPTAGPGQSWYLWKPWPLSFEYMTYAEPYDIPPYQPWMVMRNIVPITAPPPGQGDYVIRARRRGRR